MIGTDKFPGYHPLKLVVDGWLGKIDRARDMKKAWQDVADECTAFFCGATNFLWDPKYRHKFWNSNDGAVKPRFMITIAKAFELVATFGPVLYWRNPTRTATPRESLEVPPEVQLRMMGVDPRVYQQAEVFVQQAEQMQQSGQPLSFEAAQSLQWFQQVKQQLDESVNRRQTEQQDRQMRAQMMERYLNWTPFELDLHRHAEMAITECLIKGRGVLFQEVFRPPGTDRRMVGSFYQSVDDFYIDGDAESPDEAWWISRELTKPVWYWERKFGYPPGTLQPAATFESVTSQGERAGNAMTPNHRAMGETNDLLKVQEVWTRNGPGGRQTGVTPALRGRLQKVVGDYCHFYVAPGVPFFLNLPDNRTAKAPGVMDATDDEVREAFQWPTPHWRDGRWPCAILDFYPRPKSPWPIAPLAPGLGELKAINIILAHLVSRIWMSSRDFIGVLESAADKVEKVLKDGEDLGILRIDDLHGTITNAVSFLQHPQTNLDVWKILEALLTLFERRTGLNELLAGAQEKVDRSATSTRIRQQNLSVRPDQMAAKVEAWMTEAALREALAVRWNVRPEDTSDLWGAEGTELWRRYIAEAPVEQTIRDLDFRLEANSARKPNLERDIANIQEALQTFGPIHQGYMQQSGDVDTLNALQKMWGKKTEMDVSGLMMKPPQPPQDDQLQQQGAQQELQQDAAAHQQEVQQKDETHRQEIQQDAESHQQQIQQARLAADVKLQIARAQAAAAQRAKSKGTPKR